MKAAEKRKMRVYYPAFLRAFLETIQPIVTRLRLHEKVQLMNVETVEVSPIRAILDRNTGNALRWTETNKVSVFYERGLKVSGLVLTETIGSMDPKSYSTLWLKTSHTPRLRTGKTEKRYNHLFDLREKKGWRHNTCGAYLELPKVDILWRSAKKHYVPWSERTTKDAYASWVYEEAHIGDWHPVPCDRTRGLRKRVERAKVVTPNQKMIEAAAQVLVKREFIANTKGWNLLSPSRRGKKERILLVALEGMKREEEEFEMGVLIFSPADWYVEGEAPMTALIVHPSEVRMLQKVES